MDACRTSAAAWVASCFDLGKGLNENSAIYHYMSLRVTILGSVQEPSLVEILVGNLLGP